MERRIYIPTMKDVIRAQRKAMLDPVSHVGHEQLHSPSIFVYTSKATLDTNAGTGFRLPRGGEITRISGRVSGAPSGDMSIDVLMNAVSVFGGGYLKIPSGTKVTKEKIVNRAEFNEDTVFTVQINTINSATGPLVVVFEYETVF